MAVKVVFKKEVSRNLIKWFWICSCPLYFSTLFYVVFFSGRRPSASLGAHHVKPRLEPFTMKWYLYKHVQDVNSVYLDVIGNIVMFVPFSLFLFIVFGFRRLDYILLLGFLLSLAIEITQYITGVGFPDIDDVIFNTFGTVLGLLIITGVNRVVLMDVYKKM
jgi:glycopeptide antibiotics resistance protein